MTLDATFIIQKERMQDLIREAEQDRLVQLAKLQRTGQPALHRNLVAWMGIQMVKWGSKLQQYGSVLTAASTPAVQTEYLRN